MKKILKILIGFIIIAFIGVLGKTLYIANKIDKNIKIEKKINEEKEELKGIFLSLGNEIRIITDDKNSSMGQKINKIEEFDKLVFEKIKNSHLSFELKDLFIETSPKFIEMAKNMGYANIYINEAFETLDLSYIDLAEKKFEKLGNEKIKVQSKKYCSILKKVIIGLRDDSLTEEVYNEALKNEQELAKLFYDLSGGILD